MTIRRWPIYAFLMLLTVLLLPGTVFAAEAENISSEYCVTDTRGVKSVQGLFDGITEKGSAYPDNMEIDLAHEKGIGSLYLIFDVEYGTYQITDNSTGETGTWGGRGILHEFVDLEGFFGHAPESITLSFTEGKVRLNEIMMFSSGETPDYVQKWEIPEDERADLVLFSTHCDDDQLFFAGILPYYAGELGYRVQVVYLTNHRNLTNLRCHEALDGLWSVGVTRYPVFGTFGDYYGLHSLKNGYDLFNVMGSSDKALMSFVVEQFRHFKPLVAVGHDVEGEYGHSQHMVYADLLIRASKISMDSNLYPESAKKYGVWDLPKLYLHLYPENEITMDWDQPLEHFDGMTAYQVSKYLGFPCHASQVKDFLWYMEGAELATEVEKYSPCYYGLVRSTVGEDTEKNDFFENLNNYDEQDRLAEERARREAEEARKAAEEAERLHREEEAAAAERTRLRQEEQENRRTAQRRNNLKFPVVLCIGLGILLVLGRFAASLDQKKK